MVWDADDLAAFCDPDMPGYAVALIGGTEVPGRFLENYQSMLDVGASSPAFRCSVAAVAAVSANAAVTISGINYTVAGPVERSSTGTATLRLRDA